MSERDTATAFIDRFCAGDVAGLKALLTSDLKFVGPLHQSNSREAYLAILNQDPPEPTAYELVSVTEGERCVAVFYRYQKAAGALPIAQLFRFRDDKISEILVIFDGRALR